MRIHRLEVAAFGPFADRQSVDFDELSSAGLFLLNGETGAGKTSVLDAICYALYGGLPGAREGSTRLRSDHAADSVAPEVVCEFSTGGRRFEVLRSPAWDRPKSRGAGTTRQQAQSRLRELVDGVWLDKSARNDEVSGEVRAVLGLDKEQFTKVAMLPQGEFASFLRAKDRDRESLLKRLFDTTTYASVEQLLADRLAAARTEAEDAGRERSTLLEHLRTEAAAELAVAPSALSVTTAAPAVEGDIEATAADAAATAGAVGTVDDPLDVPDELLPRAVADLLELRLSESDEDLRSAESALSEAQAASRDLEARRDDHRLLRELDERRARHGDASAAAQEATAALRAHVRAQAATGQAKALAEAEAGDTSAQAANREALDAVRVHPLADAYLGRRDAAEEAWATASDQAAVLLAALPREEEHLAQRRRELGLARDIESLERALAKDEADDAATRSALPALREDVEESGVLAATLEARRGELENSRRTLQSVRAREAHRPVVAAAAEAWVRAQEAALRARGDTTRMARARLAQAAAALAIELVDGEPCAVCGSPEHPEPASLGGGTLVSESDEAVAEAKAREAEERESVARAALEAARAEEARLDALAGGADASGAEQAVGRSELGLAEAQAAVERHLAARSAEAEARRVIDELGSRLAQTRQRLSGLRSGLAELEAASERRQGELADLRGDHTTLKGRLDDVRRAERLLRSRADAERAAADAAEAVAGARAAWHAALREQGFSDADDRLAALLEPDRERQLRTVEAEHQAEAVRLETLAAHPGIVRARGAVAEGGGGPTDAAVAEAAALRAARSADRDSAHRRRAVLDAYAARFGATRTSLDQLLSRLGPVLERYETVKSVAELVRGGGENLLRMTLSTYVLAARLEAVAAAATERLRVMSNGRYAMVHDDGRRGNNKSGLGLQVVDAWTGQQRDTSTLSGGEAFMASLSLALGLADVVQHESGGIDMETLFVDEGFGSLDEGALELVMDAIDGLRDGGRTVGVVSHVPEMKQRIPAQLRVEKGRHGSRLSVVMDAVGVH